MAGGFGVGCKLLNWLCRFLKIVVNVKVFIGRAAGKAEGAEKEGAALLMKTGSELNRNYTSSGPEKRPCQFSAERWPT